MHEMSIFEAIEWIEKFAATQKLCDEADQFSEEHKKHACELIEFATEKFPAASVLRAVEVFVEEN